MYYVIVVKASLTKFTWWSYSSQCLSCILKPGKANDIRWEVEYRIYLLRWVSLIDNLLSLCLPGSPICADSERRSQCIRQEERPVHNQSCHLPNLIFITHNLLKNKQASNFQTVQFLAFCHRRVGSLKHILNLNII